MTKLREAVDRIALVREATQFGSIEAEPEYKTFDTLADAARTLLAILDASEEVSWCEVHEAPLAARERHSEDYDVCVGALSYRSFAPKDLCRIVSVRLISSSLLAGLGET